MTTNRNETGIRHTLVSVCMVGCILAGCTVVGPTAIRSGRLAYNEAITETNNQQMLMVAIHNRYLEKGSLLAVSSVTANVSVTTAVGVQLGFGDSDNYAGNLVPLGAGTVYEENPTISYTPVEGEKYSRYLFSPVAVAVLARFSGTMAEPTHIFTTLVSSVNGIHNPDFIVSGNAPDPRFERFIAIMSTLTRAKRLHWVENPQTRGSFSVLIDRFAPDYLAEVRELLHLLGLPALRDPSQPLIIPVSLTLDARDTSGIAITTYSVYHLLEVLSAAIEVPDDEQNSGIAASYPPMGLVGKGLRIHCAADRPKHAYVAVKHHDNWFYIDETDQTTKQFFRILTALWSVTIAESAGKASSAPVLTVPVSR